MFTKKNTEEEEQKKKEVEYDMHIPTEFDVVFVVADMVFTPKQPIKPEYHLGEVQFKGRSWYLPPIDLGQPYIPTTHSKRVGVSAVYTLTLRLYGESYYKYLLLYPLGHI